MANSTLDPWWTLETQIGPLEDYPVKITHNRITQWTKNPPEKQTDQRDESGLIVRRNIDGSITFCCRKRIGSRRVRKTFGHYPELSLAEARKEARAWLSGMVPEAEIGTRSKRRTTWGDVVDAYITACKAKNKSWKQQEYALLRYPPKAWWAIPAEDLTKVRVLDLLMGMNGKYQANRLLAYMKAAMNHAAQLDLIETNPIQNMKRPFKEEARKNILDFQRIHTLWNVCNEHDVPASKAIQLLLLTGNRRGEILSRRWDEITPDRWLMIPTNKPDRPHKVYLADLAWEIIENLPSRGVSPFLFPSPDPERPTYDIKGAKKTISRMADIGPWQVRDLRATFISLIVEHCKVLPVVAQVCANHELVGVTDRNYLVRRSYYPACKEAWTAWDRLVRGIVYGKVGQVVALSAAANS